MDWALDNTGRTYTLTQGTLQAMVWHASTGEWIAMISQRQQAIAHKRCPTLQEAKGWCEQQLQALAQA
jgi:hypothetical protein